jgi:hypothetical protein
LGSGRGGSGGEHGEGDAGGEGSDHHGEVLQNWRVHGIASLNKTPERDRSSQLGLCERRNLGPGEGVLRGQIPARTGDEMIEAFVEGRHEALRDHYSGTRRPMAFAGNWSSLIWRNLIPIFQEQIAEAWPA